MVHHNHNLNGDDVDVLCVDVPCPLSVGIFLFCFVLVCRRCRQSRLVASGLRFTRHRQSQIYEAMATGVQRTGKMWIRWLRCFRYCCMAVTFGQLHQSVPTCSTSSNSSSSSNNNGGWVVCFVDGREVATVMGHQYVACRFVRGTFM